MQIQFQIFLKIQISNFFQKVENNILKYFLQIQIQDYKK